MATFYVNSSANDGEILNDGFDTWDYTGNDLTFGELFGDGYTVGLRFSSVNIPQGSTINSATIKGYTSSVGGQSGSEVVRTKIYGIDEDDTADFTSDPTGRTKTTASVDWDFTPSVSTSDYTSPSIVSIIQEIVDRGSWASGNDLGLLIENDASDTVRWVAYSYDGDSTKDFELTVTWTAPSTSTSSTSTSTSTSTSSSSSSSSTSSSSTTTQQPDPNYAQGIVRVTKEGKDVIDSNFLDDFFLDSKYALLKVHEFGSFTTNTAGRKTINHTLGYIPYVIVFSQYLEDDGGGGVTISTEFYQHDWYLEGASYYSRGYTKVYDDKLEIHIENINTPTPGTIDGFYYIFKEEASSI